MKFVFDQTELQERIDLNFNRLKGDPYYQTGQIFSPSQYEWYGDKEGRALLAFVCHYKISGQKINCMDEMLLHMKSKTNEQLFFGPCFKKRIHEQQLSGHSWLLRGLCEYHEQFKDPFSIHMISSICKRLYLPTRRKFHTYPINRTAKRNGNVSGNTIAVQNGWILSTDVGCAFMSIDGLSHAYQLLKDETIKELIDEMIDVYLHIDKKALMVQTHCTLTAARGMLRMYEITGDTKYLNGAVSIYDLYTKDGGMTCTYQNVNWWGRNDTWTEPCAIVDSLILACKLYLFLGEDHYRKTAARIYHNGLASAQRSNGGAGTDSVVTTDTNGSDTLFSQLYEAYFCCTMRLAEGLWYIWQHQDLLQAQITGCVTQQENGCYMDGDILYAEIQNADHYLTPDKTVTVDGHRLHPLLKYYKIPQEDMERITSKILFDHKS